MADPADSPPPPPPREEDDAAPRDDESDSDLDPESEILAPVQARIEEQLRRQLDETQQERREADGELRRLRIARETAGTDLYGQQQQLALLQENVAKEDEAMGAARRLAESREADRLRSHEESAALAAEITSLKHRLTAATAELDKLGDTVRRVEAFNTQLAGEMAVERRVAHKLDKDVATAEAGLSAQDKLIEELTAQRRSLEEQAAAYDAQIVVQLAETAKAKEALGIALREMDAARVEQRHALAQWTTAVATVRRRDDALQAAEGALERQREELGAIDAEIAGARAAVEAEQLAHEKLTARLGRLQSESAATAAAVDALLQRKQKAVERYAALKRSLDVADADTRRVDAELKAVRTEIAALQTKIAAAARHSKSVESSILQALSDQTTLRKGSSAVISAVAALRDRIGALEAEAGGVEHEIEVVRCDELDVRSGCDGLKAAVAEATRELNEAAAVADQIAVESRRKHDEITRRQKVLDGLNRQLEKIRAARAASEAPDASGPLEATISVLSRELTAVTKANRLLEAEWVRVQTELVAVTTNTQRVSEAVAELRGQAAVLAQRKARLVGEAQGLAEETSAVTREVRQLQLDAQRINTAVAKSARTQEELADATFAAEGDLVRRLRERKEEALALESQVHAAQMARQELIAELVELERGALFWTKKVAIAKETSAALDPKVGQEEANRMRAEITSMESRVAALKRDLAKRVHDIEREVSHRDLLRTRGRALAGASGTTRGVAATRATLQRENARIAHDVKRKSAEEAKKEAQMLDCVRNTERVAAEVARVATATAELHSELSTVQAEAMDATAARTLALARRARAHATLARLRDAERSHAKPTDAATARAAEERERVAGAKEALIHVVESLAAEFPAHERDIRRLLLFADVPAPTAAPAATAAASRIPAAPRRPPPA